MRVKMADLARLLEPHRDRLLDAAETVIRSGHFVQGPHIEALEEQLAHRLGVRHAIAVSSGTDALMTCLSALDIGPGDLVLTTAYSFVATATAILHTGAHPVFVDIDPATFNLCPQSVLRWFETHPADIERVKAVIPVHLFGQCADMTSILEIANSYGIPVIEDAAQALGAIFGGPRSPHAAGTMGTFGCFSFFATKNLGALGEGGLIVTHDASLAERTRRLRLHGRDDEGRVHILGGNHRLPEIQAAFLLELLPHLDAWNARRRQNAHIYDEALTDLRPARPFGEEAHVFHHYVVRTPSDRDKLQKYLRRMGIETAVYYPRPIHHEPLMAPYRTSRLVEAERAAQNTLALPIHPALDPNDVKWAAETIKTAFKNHESI